MTDYISLELKFKQKKSRMMSPATKECVSNVVLANSGAL